MARQILVIVGTDGRPPLPGSDRAALALAVSGLEGEVVAWTRPGDLEACRYAAASGIETFLDPEGLEGCAFDVALVGRGGCGEEGDLLPARLAEAAKAALVYEALDVRPREDRLEVTRDLGRGARDVLSVKGPAVLVLADSAPSGGYISRRRVLAAAVPSVASSAPSSETSVTSWERTRPRVRLGDHRAKTEGSATHRMKSLLGLAASPAGESDRPHLVTGSAETCARHLLQYLVHHGFLAVDRMEAEDVEVEAETGRRAEPRPPRSAAATKTNRGPRLARGPHRRRSRPEREP